MTINNNKITQMIQHTIWFWTILNLAGLLSLVVSLIMVIMNKDTKRFYWLRLFTVVSGIGYLLVTSAFLLNPDGLSAFAQIGTIVYSFIIVFLCLYLFFHPSLLYGSNLSFYPVPGSAREIPEANKPEIIREKQIQNVKIMNDAREVKEKSPSPTPKASLSIEQSLKYRQMIKDHFSKSLAFRKPGYAIRDLSNETGIPGYLVSLFINQEYGMNFNEYVNAYRVEYLAGLLKTSFDCESYTLEAIGKMAGFNSRTAFIAAIKKYTGMTPSTFFGRKYSETVEYPIFNFPERMRDVA